MSAERFNIFFSGQIIEGHNEAEVRAKIGRIFKANPKQLKQLFSGEPVKIKSGVDLDKAVKYRVTFRDAGALVDIKPISTASTAQPPVKTTTQPSPATQDEVELLPPQTGSLIDCAPEGIPAAIPNIDNIMLGNNTAPLDETEPPPPADIDTSNLTLSTPNTGTLEDCQQPVEAAELPDISALEMVEPETKRLQ